VLQCVAVCCSVLQCVAVCCSVLQCVAVCCSVLQCVHVYARLIMTETHEHISIKLCVPCNFMDLYSYVQQSHSIPRQNETRLDICCQTMDWFRLWSWLSHNIAICTRIALLWRDTTGRLRMFLHELTFSTKNRISVSVYWLAQYHSCVCKNTPVCPYDFIDVCSCMCKKFSFNFPPKRDASRHILPDNCLARYHWTSKTNGGTYNLMNVCRIQLYGCVYNTTWWMCVQYNLMNVCTIQMSWVCVEYNLMDVCIKQFDGCVQDTTWWMCVQYKLMDVYILHLDGCVYNILDECVYNTNFMDACVIQLDGWMCNTIWWMCVQYNFMDVCTIQLDGCVYNATSWMCVYYLYTLHNLGIQLVYTPQLGYTTCIHSTTCVYNLYTLHNLGIQLVYTPQLVHTPLRVYYLYTLHNLLNVCTIQLHGCVWNTPWSNCVVVSRLPFVLLVWWYSQLQTG